jgi:hypothetical protein
LVNKAYRVVRTAQNSIPLWHKETIAKNPWAESARCADLNDLSRFWHDYRYGAKAAAEVG